MDFPKNHKVVNKVRFLVKKRKDNQAGYWGNKNVYYQVKSQNSNKGSEMA
jgi:hypothetical protein